MRTVPPVLPDNEAGWPFGDLAGDEDIPEGTTAAWALVTRAAWRLLCTTTKRPGGQTLRPPPSVTAADSRKISLARW